MSHLRRAERWDYRREPGGHIPMRLDELDDGTRATVRAFRHWVSGPDEGNDAWSEIALHYGGTVGKPLMGALILLVERIRATSHRRFRHHARCCPCLSTDERLLLDMIGEIGSGRLLRAHALAVVLLGHDEDRARFFPETLAVTEAAGSLARAMARTGVQQ